MGFSFLVTNSEKIEISKALMLIGMYAQEFSQDKISVFHYNQKCWYKYNLHPKIKGKVAS